MSDTNPSPSDVMANIAGDRQDPFTGYVVPDPVAAGVFHPPRGETPQDSPGEPDYRSLLGDDTVLAVVAQGNTTPGLVAAAVTIKRERERAAAEAAEVARDFVPPTGTIGADGNWRPD